MLKQKLEEIFKLTEKGNNLGEEIIVVGATKTMSAEVINEAIGLGLKVVAENRVQEFNQKHGLIVGAEEHFIGHLQTNKVKYLVGKVSLIHSVDSIKLAQAIDKEAEKKGVIQKVLVEINAGGELSKSGFSLDDAISSVEEVILSFPHLEVQGLMAMLPNTSDEKELIRLCTKMRSIYDALIDKGYKLKHLSMGMSNDYKIAIQNGSNMIRLGRTIFGERSTNGSI
jgi:pyridoxal phosphate enzyme (YggS family)